jgi:prophage regulatory protein
MQQPDTATHHAEPGAADAPRDRLIRDKEVDLISGIKKSLRYELMRRGEFPQSVKITPRCVAWSERQVLQWVHGRINAGCAK